MKRYFFLIATAIMAIGLSACASPQERADAQFRKDEKICEQAGFTAAVEKAQCTNDALDKKVKTLGSKYPDLLELVKAYNIKLAREMDENKISRDDANLEFAKFVSQVTAEIQRRDGVRAQNAANALAVVGALRSAMPNPLPVQSIPDNRPIQTNCYGSGSSFNCTSQPTGIDTSMYRTR